MRKALIVGCGGQDGTYLVHLLREKGYAILGFGRNRVLCPEDRKFAPVDFRQARAVRAVLGEFRPDEIYFLAAFHHSSEDAPVDERELVERSFEVNTMALNNVLSGIDQECPSARLFYAASSRIFGMPASSPQNEGTPINPVCPYGISKAAGLRLCRYYRSQRGVFASVGIFYNHESPLRRSEFISRKVVSAAVRIGNGSNEKLVVGDLNASVDWGYAPDYVRAAWEILQLDESDEFVIGTGVTHTVREFAERSFAAVGLDWTRHVVEDSSLLTRSAAVAILRADAAKLYRKTGWQPKVSFEAMVEKMVEAEVTGAEAAANSNLYSHL